MSRIGKHPVPVPPGVTVEVDGQIVTAKGKLGSLSLTVIDDISAVLEDGKVVIKPRNDNRRGKIMWGTTRTLVSNLVKGVSEGFKVGLDITGVGYRAAVAGRELTLQLGFSHDVKFAIPEGITITAEKPTALTVFGANRHTVGQVAAVIRGYRPPEPYKGKGVKYTHETIVRKEGKKK